MHKPFIVIGAINGLLTVALGAFAAHALKPELSAAMLEVFRTGLRYHELHSLALLLTGVIARFIPASTALAAAGGSFLIGIILFPGSLYLLALTGTGWLGAITPIGGTAFLLGWALLAAAAWRNL